MSPGEISRVSISELEAVSLIRVTNAVNPGGVYCSWKRGAPGCWWFYMKGYMIINEGILASEYNLVCCTALFFTYYC